MITVIVFIFCLLLFGAATIYDIKHRQLPPALMISAAVLSIAGIIISIIKFTATGDTYGLILTIAAIGVYLGLTAVNAHRIKNNKPVLIGGADTLILLAMCTNYQTIFAIIPALIVIPLGAFVLSTIIRMIPRFNRSFTKRGIPYIPFMAVMWILTVIL